MLQYPDAARPAPPLDRLFAALADPVRLGMVERLSLGPASASQLAGDHTMTLSAVVQHLKVLESGGLVSSQKLGRVRMFTLETQALGQVERWVYERKRAWERDLDRLEQLLREEKP